MTTQRVADVKGAAARGNELLIQVQRTLDGLHLDHLVFQDSASRWEVGVAVEDDFHISLVHFPEAPLSLLIINATVSLPEGSDLADGEHYLNCTEPPQPFHPSMRADGTPVVTTNIQIVPSPSLHEHLTAALDLISAQGSRLLDLMYS